MMAAGPSVKSYIATTYIPAEVVEAGTCFAMHISTIIGRVTAGRIIFREHMRYFPFRRFGLSLLVLSLAIRCLLV